MVSIHDSVAGIYERTGHGDWAAQERTRSALPPGACSTRQALCEFRSGQYRAALSAALAQSDAESRYWRARAANELALLAFKRLDELSDSPERRVVRATQARAEDRYVDAIAELNVALTLAPGDPALTYELASSQYLARDYERAVTTLAPLLQKRPEDARLLKMMGYSMLQLRELDGAVSMLERAAERDPADAGVRVALGRAHVQKWNFAAAVPLLEAHLADDRDGSLHLQLARAYIGVGQSEKSAVLLARSQELQRAAEERAEAATQRVITGPK
jgi:predicted Zn-dependent protease